MGFFSGKFPRPCTRGCGLVGWAEYNGTCSKCYNDYINGRHCKQDRTKASKLTTVHHHKVEEVTLSHESAFSAPAIKNRCKYCNKKVGLLGFLCRCGGTFCGSHRHPESHPCNFDFKTVGKIKIWKENLIIKADKIRDRV